MLFYEKLDFLMNLTDTRNSTLGRVLNFDPSYLSRLRSGKRGLPRRQAFIGPASAYFARNIRGDYMRLAAAEVIAGDHDWPEDVETAARLLENWLSDDSDEPGLDPASWKGPAGSSRDGFREISSSASAFSDISKSDGSSASGSPKSDGRPASGSSRPEGSLLSAGPAFLHHAIKESRRIPVSVSYGSAGKRGVVLDFLRLLDRQESPGRLCLYSDEDMDWLTGDASFASEWGRLLGSLAARGWQIAIIHNIDRDISDMLEAIRKWLPIYASGNVFPYFCPKVRDSILRRSIFVAPGLAALVSSSVYDSAEHMPNLLFQDADTVAAYQQEYDRLLSLCRPLMHLYRPADLARFNTTALSVIRTEKPLYMCHHGFPLYLLEGSEVMPSPGAEAAHTGTIPAEMEHQGTERPGMERPGPGRPGTNRPGTFRPLAAAASRLFHTLRELIKNGLPVVQYISLPPCAKPDTANNMGGGPTVFSVTEDLQAGLQACIFFLESFPSWHLILSDAPAFPLDFVSSEEEGVLLWPRVRPVGFHVSEQRLSSSFREYLERIAAESGRSAAAVAARREETLNRLRTLYSSL